MPVNNRTPSGGVGSSKSGTLLVDDLNGGTAVLACGSVPGPAIISSSRTAGNEVDNNHHPGFVVGSCAIFPLNLDS